MGGVDLPIQLALIDPIDVYIHAGAAQSAYREKDRELRAQYIPAIMQALAAQAQTAAIMNGGSNGETLMSMTPERAHQLDLVNPGTFTIWLGSCTKAKHHARDSVHSVE